ncbi:DUF309 domain-containing protein [Saccharopolyspora gloriosae]|uniref:DUF309 domain-containing protein n=1 Tax=Saccharopolyspora gloriosae TaxID=455344 RepID=UPI001FB75F4A|nr:DUF309 domain-containing protein [Saccharopolyspora gloriosae]
MPQRDRDPQGRARNARPRDGLGRPLPYGSAGVERVDEDMVLAPDESLAEAQQMLDDGRPFHAHEVLEAAWKNAPVPQRALWKGLAQLAVGLTHLRRGNAAGAAALLRRARDHIQPYAQHPPHSVAVDQLTRYAADLADRIERDGADVLAPDELSPRLSTTTPTAR